MWQEMSEGLLSIDDLGLGFHGDNGFALVLDGVELSMAEGEIMGPVGESGRGKTTLARAIVGVLPRNALEVRSGTIRFDGLAMLGAGKADRRRQEQVRGRAVTFIPQDRFTSDRSERVRALLPLGRLATGASYSEGQPDHGRTGR